MNIRGMAYPVETYEVVNQIQNRSENAGVLHTDVAGLRLEADFEHMTGEERERAVHILKDAVNRIARN